MKFSPIIRAVTAILLATAGVNLAATAADAHTVHPAAPQSFILLDEKSAGLLTVRTWYNTSNGGVHGEGVEAGTSFYVNLNSAAGLLGVWYGANDVNTSETFDNHVYACADDGVVGVCTGST